MPTTETFEAAVHRHDQRLAALGLPLWVGSEPTFTDRWSHAPHWLATALGGDKLARACGLMRDLSQRHPGGLTLRSVGRQYPGEKRPRWNLGLLLNRDGSALWRGPPDPLLLAQAQIAPFDLPAWVDALAQFFQAQGWLARVSAPPPAAVVWQIHTTTQAGTELTFELYAAVSDYAAAHNADADPDADGSAKDAASATATDPAAGQAQSAAICTPAIGLPVIGDVGAFRQVLRCIEQAAVACQLPALAWYGAAPPVDHSLMHTTITPDPAVIEVNCAPCASASEFLQRSQMVYGAAHAQGLSPYRLYYNGMVADSGGAGQITLGGPSPQYSPFLQDPGLLPKLVCFMNRHPSLSYLFSHDHVGSSGQSVRPDERGRDALDDLQLALALLAQQTEIAPELLWRSLAPFLCDASGNSHRAEVNIEKLWNPYLPGRGCLGLVEFRALRMQHTPERATALACLLRAVVALVKVQGTPRQLIDWGRDLHDRFALPFYLEQDLSAVLAQLEQAGLGLGHPIKQALRHDEFRHLGQLDVAGGRLELRRAIEFWPLLGDAASPEQLGTSRLVDASTARIELRWRPDPAMPTQADNWDWFANGIRLPMRPERDAQGAVHVFGVRYRSFAPAAGLHPLLSAQAPLTLHLRHRTEPLCHAVQWHEWHPLGAGYDGLPADLQQAQTRRQERLTEHQESAAALPPIAPTQANPAALRPYSLDLRYPLSMQPPEAADLYKKKSY